MDFLLDIENHVTILYPNEESFSIFKKLITKYKPRGNRVFDIEHASVAIANEITKIATFNVQDFKHIKEIELLVL